MKHIKYHFLCKNAISSSQNVSNKGPLQQTFHNCPLKNAYDLFVNILIPEIKNYYMSLPNVFTTLKKPLKLLQSSLHFTDYIWKAVRSQF